MWFLTALMAVIASLIGVANQGIYPNPKIVPAYLAQDLIAVLASISMLFLIIRIKEGDFVKQLILLGIIGYLFYVYGFYVLGKVYNILYLLYMAIFSLSFFSLVYGIANIRNEAYNTIKIPNLVQKISTAFLFLVPIILYPMWIIAMWPFMQEMRVPPALSIVYILDNCFVLPAFAIMAVMLLKKESFAILLTPVLLIKGFTLGAQDDDDDVEARPNWEVIIGGGGLVIPKYKGSDELEVEPVPYIDASWRTRYVEFFLNAEQGVGVAVELGDALPLTLSAGVNLGEGRKPDDADVLKGTPDITNSYVVFGGAELDLAAIGSLSAQVTYAPTTMDYQEAERKDTDDTGLLARLDWEYGLGFNRGMVNVELGATWMNADSTEANYSLLYPTDRLTKTFKAQSGLQDVHVSTTVIYMLSGRFAIALVGEGTYLLGDAADSPFTQSTFQPFGGAFIVYRF